MEIVKNIHKIDGVRGANCYLVINTNELILIDTGMPGNGKRIINYVTHSGKKASDVKYIILTHSDIDHVGSASKIKKLTGAQLVIHAADAPVLLGKSSSKKIKGPLGMIFKLMMPLMGFKPVEPDMVLNESTNIGGCKIIFTPGHTEGSISIYQPGNVLFAGDALRADSRGNPKLPSKSLSADIVQAMASVKTISQLDFDILLTGHGAPVIGKASARVKELL